MVTAAGARWPLALTLLLAIIIPNAAVSSTDFRGELAGAMTVNNTESKPVYLSFQYIPELYLDWSLTESKSLDVQASLYTRWTTRFESIDSTTTDTHAEEYRVWLRFNTAQSESRIGLQKISFGAATLIRPLMWFDNIDPRDPLQITKGVWGVLFRYYFVNNANVWFWGLIKNDERKGWERVPSTSDDPELGGRVQLPVPKGEIGLSYHHRTADYSKMWFPVPPSTDPSMQTELDTSVPENRVGVDGKWDVKVGLWFEGAFSHQDFDLLEYPYRSLVTVGLDYTFSLGDGLTVIGEQFLARSGEEAFSGGGEKSDVTALSLRYAHGLLDEFAVIFFYDYDQEEMYGFFDWRRRYDKWSWHVIAFSNPEELSLSFARPGSGIVAGDGLQLLVVFNH